MYRKVKNSLFLRWIVWVVIIVSLLFMVFMITILYMRNISEKNIKRLNEKMMIQLSDKIDNEFLTKQNSMMGLSYNALITDYFQNESTRYLNWPDINDTVINITLTDDSILGVGLYDNEGTILIGNGSTSLDRSIVTELVSTKYSGLQHKEGKNKNQYTIYYPIYDLKSKQFFSRIGICVVAFSVDPLDKILEEGRVTERSEIYLLDQASNIVSYAGPDNSIRKNYVDQYQGDRPKHAITRFDIPRSGWTLISSIPLHEMKSDGTSVIKYIIPFYLCVLMALVVMTVLYYRSYILPVKRLDHFAKVCNENTEARIEVRVQDEIGTLASSLNKMLDERDAMHFAVRNSLKEVYDANLEKKQFEILAYKNQINPHFLYNTLDCIKSMAIYRDCDDIAEVTVALSKILRFAVKGSDYVTIKEEADYILEYAKIIDCRFFGRICVSIDVEDGIADAKIAKLILQPIVENAVLHGLEPKIGGGEVKITMEEMDESWLEIIVADNGVGIGEEQLARIKEEMKDGAGHSQGIGITNIYQRLRLFYGEAMTFDLSSEEGKGTTVLISIPLVFT